jgi:hypothetical protein
VAPVPQCGLGHAQERGDLGEGHQFAFAEVIVQVGSVLLGHHLLLGLDDGGWLATGTGTKSGRLLTGDDHLSSITTGRGLIGSLLEGFGVGDLLSPRSSVPGNLEHDTARAGVTRS